MAKAAFHVSGLGRVRRDLKKIDVGMAAALATELRAIGNEARDKVRASTEPPYRTGKTRRSVKTSVRSGRVSLVSKEPQSPVWEYGGRIKPRGAPLTIPRTRFVGSEVEAVGEGVEDRLARIFDSLSQSPI